jgi:hypothetical protein
MITRWRRRLPRKYCAVLIAGGTFSGTCGLLFT